MVSNETLYDLVVLRSPSIGKLHMTLSRLGNHMRFADWVVWAIHTIFIVSPAKQKRDICIAFPASSLSSSSAA